MLIHTMNENNLNAYCKSKIHSITDSVSAQTEVHIIPEYQRSALISKIEKQDKLFNFKRPTAKIIDGKLMLYVFPGNAYIRHYMKIYTHLGYNVTVTGVTDESIDAAISAIFPEDFPTVDTIILGYVEPLAPSGEWFGNEDISWKVQSIGDSRVAFVGVAFSYWGDIIYHLIGQLSAYTARLIYVGKLGSLHRDDIPNKTIASGNSSIVADEKLVWNNIFEDSPLITLGAHVTVPSVLDETHPWFIENCDTYRFVDPELGWAAKSCRDNDIEFSYLHLVTGNLCGNFLEDLTNERDKNVIEKRLQYVGIMKAILWNALSNDNSSLLAAVQKAQQARVDRGLMRPLVRDWQACLSFAYHTQEEAWEIVRELPRREWKDQVVIPENVLAEIADTQIQLLTTLTYAGYTEADLRDAVLGKLHAKRKDWK